MQQTPDRFLQLNLELASQRPVPYLHEALFAKYFTYWQLRSGILFFGKERRTSLTKGKKDRLITRHALHSLMIMLSAPLCIGQIEASTCPPGHTPGIWHLCRPGEEGIWWSKSSRGWGIWSPCFRGGEFELHPRFHVKSLAWRAIMGDAVLEDFRGKDCAFVANWLRGKGLNKLCAVFEVFKF